MAMETVYNVRATDNTTMETVVLPHKRTAAGAELIEAKIILDTAEEVPAEMVDGQGRYIPTGAV